MEDATSLLQYLDLIANSTSAFAIVVLFFVWRAYQDAIQKWREADKDRADSHVKTMEVLSGNTTALTAIKDQMIELRHQIERLHDNSRS